MKHIFNIRNSPPYAVKVPQPSEYSINMDDIYKQGVNKTHHASGAPLL